MAREIYNIDDMINYLINNKSTIRETAKYYGIPKSTFFYKLKKYSVFIDEEKLAQLNNILNTNFNNKHIKGGISTKLLWEKTFDKKK